MVVRASSVELTNGFGLITTQPLKGDRAANPQVQPMMQVAHMFLHFGSKIGLIAFLLSFWIRLSSGFSRTIRYRNGPSVRVCE